MKTFKDLKFGPHPVGDGFMARLNFDNGYGVSVVRFSFLGTTGSYTNGDEWELAVLKDNELCYDTPITDNVLGHLTEGDVTEVMRKVQLLKKRKEVFRWIKSLFS